MINELFEQQGSYDLQLRSDSKQLFVKLAEYGHLVITPQEMHPDLYNDAAILSKARYAGPVLDKDMQDGIITLFGAGMVWHLGDGDGVGDQLEAGVNLAAATLSAAVGGLLPDAITAGTITNTGAGTYDGFHQFETPLSAIRTVMQARNCHFKVQPDGTIDSSLVTAADNVNPYVINDPRVVVVEDGWGDDPSYISIPARFMTSRLDARKYATRAILVDYDADEVGTLKASEDISPVTSYKDIHGNALVRTFQSSRPASEEIDTGDFLTTELTARSVDRLQIVETEHNELSGGHLGVGDKFLAYNPRTGFIDKTNQIWFRGRAMWPIETRLLEASWMPKVGQGIYYRDLVGGYINLTRQAKLVIS